LDIVVENFKKFDLKKKLFGFNVLPHRFKV